MVRFIMLMCCLLMFPSFAFAGSDVVATYKYADGNMMTLCTRDARHVRMDTSPDSYMLLKGDKVYAVSKDDEGNWHAMDLDQMQGMGGLASMFGGGASEYEVRYEKLNKNEKVAGYSGKVYSAIVYEDGQVVSRDEIVLSTHSDIQKVSDGWNAIAARMGQAMGPQMAQFVEHSSKEAKKMGYGGILRCGNQMQLHSLKTKKLAASYYELPKGVEQVNMPTQQRTTQDDSGLEQDARDIGQDARDATKDEVKEAVRGVIEGLFN